MSEYRNELAELIREFNRSGFSVLEVSSGSDRVLLKRASAPRPAVQPPAPVPIEAAFQAPKPRAQVAGEPAREPVEPHSALKSPRVGRFYQLQDAQGHAVLKAGTRLSAGQVYGIIESMRLRYEIRSDREGIIDRVLVPSGEPVEFGQPLVLLQS